MVEEAEPVARKGSLSPTSNGGSRPVPLAEVAMVGDSTHDLPEGNPRKVQSGFTIPIVFGTVTRDRTRREKYRSAIEQIEAYHKTLKGQCIRPGTPTCAPP